MNLKDNMVLLVPMAGWRCAGAAGASAGSGACGGARAGRRCNKRTKLLLLQFICSVLGSIVCHSWTLRRC